METDTKFTIKLTIPEISTFNSQIKSTPHVAGGISWNISAEFVDIPFNKYLSISFDCHTEHENPDWSCIADVTFRFLSSKGNDRYCYKPQVKCDMDQENKECLFIMFWDTLMWPGYGFVSNNCATIEAKFSVSRIENVHCFPRFDKPNHLTDAILVLNGGKLHVNKGYLSLYSPVFHAMFFSNSKITLDDDFEEFLELLRNIYPCRKPINKENVEYLMELADKYDMKSVINECAEFLIIDKDIARIKKLVLADKYSLVELRNRVIQTFKNRFEIKSLQKCLEYCLLSNATKAELMEKCPNMYDQSSGKWKFTIKDCIQQNTLEMTESRWGSKEALVAEMRIKVPILNHATYCRDANNWPVASCADMKRIIEHCKECNVRSLRGSCDDCKEHIKISAFHAKNCKKEACTVQFCKDIKKKIAAKESEARRLILQKELQNFYKQYDAVKF